MNVRCSNTELNLICWILQHLPMIGLTVRTSRTSVNVRSRDIEKRWPQIISSVLLINATPANICQF